MTAQAPTRRLVASLLLAGSLPALAAPAATATPAATPAAPPPPAADAAAAASPKPFPPEVADLLEAGDASLAAGNLKEAIRQYKQADKLRGGPCAICQLGLAKAFNGIGAHKNALESAETVLRLTQDRQLLGVAYNEQGLALLSSAGAEQGKLQRAEAAFRQVIAIHPAPLGHLNLGLALLRQGRDEEGVAALEQFLELDPHSPSAESARELIANPLRARKRLIPDLELVSLAGDYVTTDDLRGRVVLFDFWGTWCAPCRAAVPNLRNLNARLKKSPFAMVSISNDVDGETLKRFIAENRMDWLQVWDKDHAIIRRLGINRYPTYLLVDHEGEIVYSASGWGPSVEREIEARVGRAVRTAKKSAGP